MTRNIDVLIVKRVDELILTIEQANILDDLATYYGIIGCRTIDIVQRKIGKQWFDIICDDWGLIKAQENNELPTSIWPQSECLYGTLILAHHNNEGDLLSVEPNDLFEVHSALKKWTNGKISYFGALEHKA